MFKNISKKPFSERRLGKERRKYIDPRFRNPAFPEFVDRREKSRRQPVYESDRLLVQEHLSRSWVTAIGITVMAVLLWVSLIANANVDANWDGKKKGIIYSHAVLPIMLVFQK